MCIRDSHKSVLILDEYVPKARDVVMAIIKKAEEYGGLVILTSNYSDPFKFMDKAPIESLTQTLIDGAGIKSVPDFDRSAIEDMLLQMDEDQAVKNKAMRSRFAAMFRLIEFTGEDRRLKNSFWG